MVMHSNLDRVIDDKLVLRPAAAAAIAAAGTVAESGNVIDLGPGYHRFDVFIDVTSIDVSDTDDIATIGVFGSNDSPTPFASVDQLLHVMRVGHASAILSTHNRGAGEYVMPAHNVGRNNNGVDEAYRFIRMKTVVAGADVSPSLDFVAYLCKRT